MSVWQYGQLTITLDARTQERSRTIFWHGPGAGTDDDLSESEQTVLELFNQFGANGWELAGVEEDRQGGNRGTDWGATWSLTIYTFKRAVPELHVV
jgi:hypothetical protein